MTFENITRRNGNGTIFEFTSLSTSFTLSGMRFIQCTCSNGYGGAIYASLTSPTTLHLSSLSFTSCTASESGGAVSLWLGDATAKVSFESCSVEGMEDVNGGFVYIECSDGYELVEQSEWKKFITNYAMNEEEKANWVKETREGGVSASLLSFTLPATCIYVGGDGEDDEYCGRENNPCLTIKHAINQNTLLRDVKLLYSSSIHLAESEGIVISYVPCYVIEGGGEGSGEEEGEEEGESSQIVEKAVSNMSDALFTLKYCETISFSSIAFTIQCSNLSNSIFSLAYTSLSLNSISFTPSSSSSSSSTTSTQLSESLIVCSYGCSLNACNLIAQAFTLPDGKNGSAISARVSGGGSFVVVNSSFSNCSAEHGGAVYVVIGSDPLLINMSGVTFEGNTATKEGKTLYVVWRGVESMTSNQFSSFVG